MDLTQTAVWVALKAETSQDIVALERTELLSNSFAQGFRISSTSISVKFYHHVESRNLDPFSVNEAPGARIIPRREIKSAQIQLRRWLFRPPASRRNVRRWGGVCTPIASPVVPLSKLSDRAASDCVHVRRSNMESAFGRRRVRADRDRAWILTALKGDDSTRGREIDASSFRDVLTRNLGYS